MTSLFALIRESGIDVNRCQRYTLDQSDYTRYDPTDESRGETSFESPRADEAILQLQPPIDPVSTVLRYFIDGSRRIHKVAEIVWGGRFFPMLAGQIGVAVTERKDGMSRVTPMKQFCSIENLIALPDKLGGEIDDIQARITAEAGKSFRVVAYKSVDPKNPDRNPNDLATQKIMEEMLTRELDTVEEMATSGLLKPDRMLVRDGPLQFRRSNLPAIHVFQHVIGISKTFSTNTPLKRGIRPMDVGSLVTGLKKCERTKCYKVEVGRLHVGFWYLRMHPHDKVPNPLDGIIKIEKIAQPDEIEEDGIDKDLLDSLSLHIYEERNVTPYGTDRRWANHIYPIYLTERYLKASLDSDLKFSGYFKETK